MTVGVYGYRLTMEIKHFRAPREMHTFPLATRENLPSRSLAIPSRHQPSTRTQPTNRLIRLSIKATRRRKSLRFLRACLNANEIHVPTVVFIVVVVVDTQRPSYAILSFFGLNTVVQRSSSHLPGVF